MRKEGYIFLNMRILMKKKFFFFEGELKNRYKVEWIVDFTDEEIENKSQ